MVLLECELSVRINRTMNFMSEKISPWRFLKNWCAAIMISVNRKLNSRASIFYKKMLCNCHKQNLSTIMVHCDVVVQPEDQIHVVYGILQDNGTLLPIWLMMIRVLHDDDYGYSKVFRSLNNPRANNGQCVN